MSAAFCQQSHNAMCCIYRCKNYSHAKWQLFINVRYLKLLLTERLSIYHDVNGEWGSNFRKKTSVTTAFPMWARPTSNQWEVDYGSGRILLSKPDWVWESTKYAQPQVDRHSVVFTPTLEPDSVSGDWLNVFCLKSKKVVIWYHLFYNTFIFTLLCWSDHMQQKYRSLMLNNQIYSNFGKKKYVFV